ncbi:MAG: Lipid A export ATP-binding/permease protein MsbA [Firmicutes bacterium]|nr:Lipid A export ATP-binding/permease protein MsbA [candidate division NPL-UPA2 bacterium]
MIKYYLSRNKKITILVITFTALQALFGAGFAIIFQRFIDFSITITEATFVATDFIIISAMLLFYILLYSLVDFSRRYYRADLIVKIDYDVKTNYFHRLFQLELVNFRSKDTGHYLSRFTEDIPRIIKEYIIEFFNLLLYIFQATFTIFVAFYINWLIAIIFSFLSLIIIIYTTFFEKKFKSIREEMSSINSEYVVELNSFLRGFDEIKMQQAEQFFLQKYNVKVGIVNRARKKWWLLDAVYSPGNAFLTLLLTFTSIVLATLFYINGTFTIGLLTASIYLSSQIYNPISNTFEQLTYLKANKNLAKVVFDEVSIHKNNYVKVVEDIETIILSKTSVKYSNADEYILKDIDLEIKKGKKYLIVGRSGIGKSTFLKLLMGSLRYEGSIKINSIELSEINKISLYSNISYVPQTPYIFNDSIINNIDMKGQYSREEVEGMIEKVNLKEFVLNKGLDTYISEEVSAISGGEKQRICLARALLNNPKVLLLDEVTASLDKKTAFEIEKLITTLDITTLYVCHKASDRLLETFDYIIDFSEMSISIKEVIRNEHNRGLAIP